MERAIAVKSDFALTPENASAIAELCVRLDGLPLAIELAAARIKLLPPQAMLARGDTRLKLLSGGRRDLPERQQTMRAAISWGYNLLHDEEKRLFATLSVFRGGFAIAMAEALSDDCYDVLEGLSSLVDKAFLRRDAASTDDQPRFVILETIREYGLECLAEEARLDTVRRAHARLMCEHAESHVTVIDHDNHRAALEWALTNDTALAMRLGASLWWFWYIHGHYAEGMRWLASVLALDSDDQISRCRGRSPARERWRSCSATTRERRSCSTRASTSRGRPAIGARSRSRCSSAARSPASAATTTTPSTCTSCRRRSGWSSRTGRTRKVDQLHRVRVVAQARLRARDRSPPHLAAAVPRSRRHGRRRLGAAQPRRHGVPFGRSRARRERLEESLSWSRAGGFKEGIAWSLNLLGYVLRARGDIPRATAMQRDSLQLHWDLGDRWRSSSVLEALAGLALDRGDLPTAARLFGAAESLRHRHGTPVPPAEMAQYQKDATAARVDESAWDLGLSTPVEESVALALEAG